MRVGFASPPLRGHPQPTREEKLASSQSDRVGQCRSQRSPATFDQEVRCVGERACESRSMRHRREVALKGLAAAQSMPPRPQNTMANNAVGGREFFAAYVGLGLETSGEQGLNLLSELLAIACSRSRITF